MASREYQICYLWDAVERSLPYGCMDKVSTIVHDALNAMTDAELLEEYECANGIGD